MGPIKNIYLVSQSWGDGGGPLWVQGLAEGDTTPSQPHFNLKADLEGDVIISI